MFNLFKAQPAPAQLAWEGGKKFRAQHKLSIEQATSPDQMELVLHDYIHWVTGLSPTKEDEALVEQIEALLMAGEWPYSGHPVEKYFQDGRLTELVRPLIVGVALDRAEYAEAIEPTAMSYWWSLCK